MEDFIAWVGPNTLPYATAVFGAIALVIRVILGVVFRDAPGNRTTAVAFAPPRDVTPLLAGQLRRDSDHRRAVIAEILDMAVNGPWSIGVRGEGPARRWVVMRPEADEATLDGPQRLLSDALFGREGALEADFDLDEQRLAGLRDTVLAAGYLAEHRGWVSQRQDGLVHAWRAALALTIVATFGQVYGPIPDALPWTGVGIALAVASAFIRASLRTLTATGRRLNDELDGLKLFMTTAESQRLRALQAPGTAEVTASPGVGDSLGRLHLHERLLPYAVLFDVLPDWVALVARDHAETGTAPAWLIVPGVEPDASFDAFVAGDGFAALGDVAHLADDLSGAGAIEDLGSLDGDGAAGIGDGGGDGGDGGDGGGGGGD